MFSAFASFWPLDTLAPLVPPVPLVSLVPLVPFAPLISLVPLFNVAYLH